MNTTKAHLFLLILALLFSFSTVLHATQLNCHKSDRDALLKAKQALGNPPELSTWLPNTNCCNWDQNTAQCRENGRIVYVFIYRANVKANVPSAFADLPYLEILSLRDMPGLAGSIPSSFAKLSSLISLDISNTSLSGSIPDFLGNLNLSSLYLNNNKLSGPIPRSLSKLRSLSAIDLSYNKLSGSVPPMLLYSDYQFLILSNNQLSGEIPKSLGKGDLYTVDLSRNKLTGDASFFFAIDRNTDKIDLSWNQLEFDITKTMFPSKLTYLDLSHNRIRGAVSKSLKDLYQLKYLNLSYNELCGEIPTGRAMVNHDKSCYLHNKCLCGKPLPPCSKWVQ